MQEAEFLQLIDRHQGIIHKICRLYRDHKEDREDLFQEIVFQLWKSVPTFDNRAKFSTWMYKVALSTALAAYRKKRPTIMYLENLPEHAEVTPETSEQATQLFEVLKHLDDSDKALIVLYLEDLNYKEIAEITGITENHVGVKLNRIKNKIQKLIKSEL